MRLECDDCGLAACDLSDGIDPELIFEREGDTTLCQGCMAARYQAGPDALPTWVEMGIAMGDAGEGDIVEVSWW